MTPMQLMAAARPLMEHAKRTAKDNAEAALGLLARRLVLAETEVARLAEENHRLRQAKDGAQADAARVLDAEARAQRAEADWTRVERAYADVSHAAHQLREACRRLPRTPAALKPAMDAVRRALGEREEASP